MIWHDDERRALTTGQRIAVLYAAVLLLVVTVLAVTSPAPPPPLVACSALMEQGADRPSRFTRCVEEDQPGWDCRTMGNRVCGPLVRP